MKAIDLFAGCGGLSLGFLQAGYSIDRAVEYDPVIANTYQKNHPEVKVIVDDIKNIDAAGTFKLGDADVIIGGPPCQGFSMAGARIRHGFIDDPRNYLFKHYFNVVRTVKPKVFVMENVKGMQNMQGGKIFKEILNIFSDPKMNDGVPYTLYHRVIKAVEFGVPQKRERLIIVGTTIPGVLFDWLWNETCADITNVQAVVNGDTDERLAAVDKALAEKQAELLEAGKDQSGIDEIGDAIISLREERQDILTEAAMNTELIEKLEDLTTFLDEQTEALTEYSEAMVRRLIARITVYEEKMTVEFKSGLEIDVDA